eukprot:10573719-Ditylum_brightwellii.AAC.1
MGICHPADNTNISNQQHTTQCDTLLEDDEDDWDIAWDKWMSDVDVNGDQDITTEPLHLLLQKALLSILSTNAGQALLSAPRTIWQHRLSPLQFHIALCRQLQLPIHQKQQPCICGKIVDRYGDHYFD